MFMKLKNGAQVIACDLGVTERQDGTLHGFVLAKSGEDFVVWHCVQDETGEFECFWGDYSRDPIQALETFRAKRINRSRAMQAEIERRLGIIRELKEPTDV